MARAEAVYMQQISMGTRYDTIPGGYITIINQIDSIVVNEDGQCPVKWGQWAPYNTYCPFGCPTGCVATAVAQLMSIYRYPTSYAGYTFDWDAMIADSTNNGVAQLMYLLGLYGNLGMNYSPTGSNAALASVPHTLENFGYYDGGEHALYRTIHIMADVMSGRPVLIDGVCSYQICVYNPLGVLIYFGCSQEGGRHTWLGDGGKIITVTSHIFNFLDGSYTCNGPVTYNYVHCNFGWKESWTNPNEIYDGFFLTDDIGYFYTGKPDPNQIVLTDEYGNTHIYCKDFEFLRNQYAVTDIRKNANIMKRIILLLFATVGISSFISCNGKDEEAPISGTTYDVPDKTHMHSL